MNRSQRMTQRRSGIRSTRLQLDGYEYDDVEVTLVPPHDYKRWTEKERHVLRQAVAEAGIDGAYHDDWHRIYGPLNAVADKLGRSFDKVRRYALYLKLLQNKRGA